MSLDRTDESPEAGMAHGSDAHGEAAILLVESLIHGLIARNVITAADAVEIVDTAIDVRVDGASDRDDPPAHVRKALGLLEAISNSLSRDAAKV